MKRSIDVVWQVTSCREISRIGYLRPIPGGITTLPVARGIQGRRCGLSKAVLSQNGNHLDRVLFCGFTANVGTRPARMLSPELMAFPIRSRRREERLLVRLFCHFSV